VKLIIRAELPGVKKEEVKAEITDSALIIQGERREEQEKRERNVYRSEWNYGSFYRRIPLPEGVDGENATA
jgi:HSP20 family protein